MPTYLPYALVQVVGAIYWGYSSRLGIVRETISNKGGNFYQLFVSALILGAVGAIIMSLLSAWIHDVILNSTAPREFWAALLQTNSSFLSGTPSEIASKVPTVIVGILLLRATFPIFLRTRVFEVRSSGWLPQAGLFLAFGLLIYGLQESLGHRPEASPVMTMGWILLFPMLGVMHEILFLKSASFEHRKQSRISMYLRLDEVAKDSNRTFDFTAVITLMGFFLLSFFISSLVSISEQHLISNAMLFVLVFLIVTWTLEVSARHNRLDQLLVAEATHSPVK